MVLVTGATGFIGARLVKRLVAGGRAVRALVVDGDPRIGALEGVDCERVVGDITREATLAAPLAGASAVVHLAAVLVADDPGLFRRVNLEGTRHLVAASVAAGVRHFVYVSAAAAGYRVRTTYGETKHLAEQLMHDPSGRTRFTIVRPTLVFGPGGGGQELVAWVNELRKLRWFIPFLGRGQARKRWVLVDDLVDGLVRVVERPVSQGKTYNLAGGDAHSMREYTEMVCRRLGLTAPIVAVPLWLCWLIAGVLRHTQRSPLLKRDTIIGMTMDADFEIDSARRELGYNPIGFAEWLFTKTSGDPFWSS